MLRLRSILTPCSDVISAASPDLFNCKYGPGETLRTTFGVVPTVSISAISNRVTLTYGDHFATLSNPTTTEILCTFAIVDTDFPDELPVAAQSTSYELNVGTSATYSTYVISRPGE
jgi:hypothetical protein